MRKNNSTDTMVLVISTLWLSNLDMDGLSVIQAATLSLLPVLLTLVTVKMRICSDERKFIKKDRNNN